MDGIRAMQMRGGTSKGLYFLADDLPADCGAAGQHRRAGELVQPTALHIPRERRVHAAPAELTHAETHDRGRYSQARPKVARGHGAVMGVVTVRSGITR